MPDQEKGTHRFYMGKVDADGLESYRSEPPDRRSGGRLNDTRVLILRSMLKEKLGIEMGEAKLVYQHEHGHPDGPRVSLRFFSVRNFAGEVRNLAFEQVYRTKLTALDPLDSADKDRPIVQRSARVAAPCLATLHRLAEPPIEALTCRTLIVSSR